MMGLFDIFRRKPSADKPSSALSTAWTTQGIEVRLEKAMAMPSLEALQDSLDNAGPDDSVLGAYLSQLVLEGECELRQESIIFPWERVYELLASEEHVGALQFFDLPELRPLQPLINSTGTLSDAYFDLKLEGWALDGREVRLARLDGAVAVLNGERVMLSPAAWGTVSAIERFSKRSDDLRTQHENELAWGRIRSIADQAQALYLTPYLETTYVLTPKTLRLPMKREETPFGRVVTVSPTFEGAPDGWLKAFDGFNAVQPHYDVTGKGVGRVRIVISEPVRKVLDVIKREMPGRRVAGSRAEKFVHNPWAFLGDTAHEVLNVEEYAEDRADAGSVAAIFSVVARIEDGRLNMVELSITEHFSDGTARHVSLPLKSSEELESFVEALHWGLQEERERFPWEEYDLTIDAEATVQLEQAQHLLHLWRCQPEERISFEDIYELDGYSSRIEGIGVAKAIYIPVFQKPTDENEESNKWIPTDLTPMVRVTLQGHEGDVLIPLTKEWVEEFEQQVSSAETAGISEVINTVLPTPILTGNARALVDGFSSMLGAQDRVKSDESTKPKEKKAPEETLLVKTNFHGVDYEEARKASLRLPEGSVAVLPKALRKELELKEHQLYGVAWFQHLVSKAPVECRGALLADDMGLGKTLQLLTVLAQYYEVNPNAAPSIVFAPKSLLENWANEAAKFFTPSFPEVLILYGDELTRRKQPVGLIDDELRTKGIVELLKPHWVGSAKVIVSTYDVLTSYEFSFARQAFAFVICDEAQRIKTPGTAVTLAAKKLKADFRIACTGTPVENSLSDLWCLFDFVQPGLLGALEEFGKTYRRPIECETDEQKDALRKLQRLISHQTLRRTKADIAAELPKKYFGFKKESESEVQFKERLEHHERLDLPMSEHQKILYKGGLKKLQDAHRHADGRARARLSFGALHLMKAVCAEPYCLPSAKFLPDIRGIDAHLDNSPKLAWLLRRLAIVQKNGEKAIVFTELREAQAALYYFLRETFGIKPFIINGDSQGRQTYIDKFSSKPGFDVIILSTLAAGAGLNVTAANHIFHFTRAWNPAKEAQATDRAFRIGQQRDVFVYCPTVVADFTTFEVRLDEILKQKAGLADSTLDKDALVSMLNGSAGDARLSELVSTDEQGESMPRRNLTIDDVDRMDGNSFEVLCCLLWRKQGFVAHVTPKRGGDGGIDVVALLGRDGELIQCKSSKSGELGWDAIKEVTAGAARYQSRYTGTRFRRVAVTNQGFNRGAIEHAEANQVRLVTRARLGELLGVYPITNYEFDDEVMSFFSPQDKAA